MKPLALAVPARDLGRARIRDFGEALIRRLESIEKRLSAKEPHREVVPPVVLSAERALLARLDSQTGDAVTLERQRIRDRALDEEYFRRELAPGRVTYQGVVTEQLRAATDTWVMTFPAVAAGDNRHAVRQVATRELWLRTRPRINVWYSSPVGSTNTFNFRFVIRCFGAGSGMVSNVVTLDWSPAGPAVANTVQFTSATTGIIFPSSPFGVVQLRLGRLGGDANANDLDVLLALVIFEEVA